MVNNDIKSYPLETKGRFGVLKSAFILNPQILSISWYPQIYRFVSVHNFLDYNILWNNGFITFSTTTFYETMGS